MLKHNLEESLKHLIHAYQPGNCMACPSSNGFQDIRRSAQFITNARLFAIFGVCAAGIPSGDAHADYRDECLGLSKLTLPAAVVLSSTPIAAGRFKGPDGKPQSQLGEFCRVVGSARPSADSDIRFEVWMPSTGWNGRLWGIGGRNFGGEISYMELGNRLTEGYAAVASDSGHATDTMDSTWAVGHPEKAIDSGYRAAHEMTVAGKRMVAAFYGRPAERAYFMGCSNGGREALMEAQRFPEDYDGIIAGAPALDWVHLETGFAFIQFTWLADPARLIPTTKLKSLEELAVKKCGRPDEIRDGFLANPQRCVLSKSDLVCDRAGSHCLTPKQFETFEILHLGPRIGSSKPLFPGFAMGSESAWDGMHFDAKQADTGAFQLANGYFRDFVHEDPAWDFHNFDPVRDGRLSEEKLAAMRNATDPDLRKFIAHGGKLILYHGWSDGVIPAASTIDYYDSVEKTVGKAATRSSVRLFMVPGMEHCRRGPGPNYFGQPLTKGRTDPERSIGALLRRWAEGGVPPDRIIAFKRADDDDPNSQVIRARPLCAWPKIARYRGTGDVDSESSFECIAPP